jgi:hypothetical protein
MKKQTFTKLLIGGTTLLALTLAANNVGAWGKSNKWNDRMVKPEDPADTNKSTKNLSTGKVTNPDGTAAPPEAPASGDLLAYGEGTLHCRDAVLKIKTKFETGAGTATSDIKVAELSHGATMTIPCASVNPPLKSNADTDVSGGTITIKCGNGQLHVAASTCTAPSPTPTPTPPDGGGTGPTPDPGGGGVPVPTPTPGYSVVACGSSCSDTISSCTVTKGGKAGGETVYKYRICQNGQINYTSNGKCGSKPAGCK